MQIDENENINYKDINPSYKTPMMDLPYSEIGRIK